MINMEAKQQINKAISLGFTIGGIVAIIVGGDLTNGLLCMIFGELIGLPYKLDLTNPNPII